MSKVCYMMIGVPASGKSTACENLLKEMPDLQVVSTDMYIEDFAKKNNKTYNDIYKELGDEPQKWMNVQIRQLMNQGKSFIWDQTNVVASARKKKLATLSQKKYEVVAIVVELSKEELNRRIKKRTEEGGKKISYGIIFGMVKNYERPEYNEGFSNIYLIGDDGEPRLLPKAENKLKI